VRAPAALKDFETDGSLARPYRRKISRLTPNLKEWEANCKNADQRCALGSLLCPFRARRLVGYAFPRVETLG
jgi:hypothetical protein